MTVYFSKRMGLKDNERRCDRFEELAVRAVRGDSHAFAQLHSALEKTYKQHARQWFDELMDWAHRFGPGCSPT